VTTVQVHEDGIKEILPQESVGLVQVLAGGKLNPVNRSDLCHVCNSPYTGFIEERVKGGVRYSKIAEHIKDWPPGDMGFPIPSARSIGRHIASRHGSLELVSEREQAEANYVASGGDLESDEESIINRYVVAQAIVQKYGQQVLKDEIKVNRQDFLIANQIVEKFEQSKDQTGISEDMWRDAMFAYIDILLPEIAPERREAVSRALENHPAMQAVAAAHMKQQLASGEVLPGEVA
jgi:hypothetical protein